MANTLDKADRRIFFSSQKILLDSGDLECYY